MDVRAAQAREHHRAALAADQQAEQHRAARDDLVRRLRADDTAQWTYAALGKAVGCSPELIAAIMRRA